MKPAIVALAALLCAGTSLAQDRIAVAVEGWTTRSKEGGVLAYNCASSNCAAGSEVSYKRQPHRPNLTLRDFVEHHRRIAAEPDPSGRLRELRISAPEERIMDEVRVLQIRRDFFWADGTSHALVESRLIGPSTSYSLVSVSPKYEWTRNNFEGFLRPLVNVASIKVERVAGSE